MSGKLYYITDTYGSLYALDDSNKLIVVNREEFATKFTLAKANNIIQKVIKPMQRYQFVLKEATNTTALANDDLIEKIKTALKQMKGLDNRLYTPRILTELFEEAS